MIDDDVSRETIEIELKLYLSLLEASSFLDALEQAGVDNWDGYSYACTLYDGDE